MKFFKLRIEKKVNGNQVSFSYPDEYKPEDINVLQYESFTKKGAEASKKRGNTDDFIYCSSTKNIDELLKLPDCEEMDKNSFIKEVETIHEEIEVVNDQNKVMAILAKNARGEILNRKDLNAIDPENKEETGITKTPTILEKINNL